MGIFLKLLTVAVFQHTAARRRLVSYGSIASTLIDVSTHSRPKAAEMSRSPAKAVCPCFNTQPPEGGWRRIGWLSMCQRQSFNTQPPEGGWSPPAPPLLFWLLFQHTAARRRLGRRSFRFRYLQSFNTQPPEGGWLLQRLRRFGQPMFQHTAARRRLGHMAAVGFARLCFNTQPPEGGWFH